MYSKKSKLYKIKFLIKVGFILAIFGILSIGGVFAYYAKDLPSPASIQKLKIVESTKIYDRTGEILLYDIHGEQKRTIISFEDMPAHIKYATIVAEDDGFYGHFGIDIKGIARAMISNIRGQGVKQGGSTITQQLIKNIYLSPERVLSRKIKEAILAIEMEIKYEKDDILNFYLNIVPYGSNAYGIEAASQTFFNKHAKDLTLAEASLLASLPNAPTYYSPFGNNPEELTRRHTRTLKRMEKLGYITKEELEKALDEKLEYFTEYKGIKAPHFVMFIREQLEKKYGENLLKNSGLKVITTLDWELQKEAEKIIEEWGEKNEIRFGAKNAALVAIDPTTGQILSMVGSRDYFDKKNDGNVNVTTRLRQPGSSFKPFAYAVAFNKGYTPDTIIFDAETNFGTQGTKEYIPQNYDEKFRGPMTFKEALAQSINVPAVKVLYLAGVGDTIKLAKSMGITSLNEPSRYGLSLVLGGGEVTLLDETSAYGVFSQDGVYNKAIGILSIISKNNEAIESFDLSPKKILNPQTARLINQILSDNNLRAPTFGENSYLNLRNIPSASKTGTTQEYRDAWTVGYTTDITVGVWVGNNDNSKMYNASGVKAAAPIWNEFMKRTYEIKEWIPKEFNKPEEITTQKPILNGLLGGSRTVKIDTMSGKLATKYTPEELIEERIFYEPHSILYFVKKDDPQGSSPSNPEKESQFLFWEKGVQKWISDADASQNNFSLDPAPQEYDDIHTEKTIPKIEIISPPTNTHKNISDVVFLELGLNYTFPINKIEIFFDNQIIKTISTNLASSNRFSTSFKISSYFVKKNNPSTDSTGSLQASSGQVPHTISIRVFDTALNKAEAEIILFVDD